MRKAKEGVDYHILRIKSGEKYPAHFMSAYVRKDLRLSVETFNPEDIIDRHPAGIAAWSIYVAVPGSGIKLKKEWGEVCL